MPSARKDLAEPAAELRVAIMDQEPERWRRRTRAAGSQYLGLDPRVRQSGSEPARHGRISKQGPGETRHVLVEAAWHAARTTGPLRAFHERIAARRGRNIATVAVARKLAVIAWHMLSRGEDYAFARASLTREKIRKLELATGAERRRQAQPGPHLRNTRTASAAEGLPPVTVAMSRRRSGLVRALTKATVLGFGPAPRVAAIDHEVASMSRHLSNHAPPRSADHAGDHYRPPPASPSPAATPCARPDHGRHGRSAASTRTPAAPPATQLL
jgi:hypothetical protein